MKHVLITGGSDGIGKVTAGKLFEAGFAVTILGRDAAKTEAAATEIGCTFVVADVTDGNRAEETVREAETANGPVDILINNAGLWHAGALDETNVEDIQHTIDVNVLGVLYYTRAVVPGMKERKGGRIINVNSQAGIYAHPFRSVYHASKWAVTGFTKALQEELRSSRIAVTGFYPGAMNTGFFAKTGDTKDRSEALEPEAAAGAPLPTA